MAEILIKASYSPHPDPEQDAMRYKTGMPVVIMPDGHPWGNAEGPPDFYILKIPGVSVESVKKYIEEKLDGDGKMLRRRVWQVRVSDLSAATRNKLASKGAITVKAGASSGPYDYTWSQIKAYFRNLDTGLDEDGEL